MCVPGHFTHALCRTPRQMGVICHNGRLSGWWSEHISRANTDREPGPVFSEICNQGEWINQDSDWKGSRNELSIMNIYYWVEALGGTGWRKKMDGKRKNIEVGWGEKQHQRCVGSERDQWWDLDQKNKVGLNKLGQQGSNRHSKEKIGSYRIYVVQPDFHHCGLTWYVLKSAIKPSQKESIHFEY